jgi:carboxyl-terminal processing protease
LLLTLLLVLAVAMVVMSFGTHWFETAPSGSDFALVEEAWQVITQDYVAGNEIDLHKLSQGAIQGMINALGDPYSAYFNAELYQQNKDKLEGALETSFDGIGAVITVTKEGKLLVVAPIAGSPAQIGGILPGDTILRIDGNTTEGMELVEAVLKVRGEPGTQVTLTVLHEGSVEPVDLVITREEITVASVLATMLPGDIAHVEILYFSNKTGSDLISALDDVIAGGAKGIILDLRDNGGGVLSAAVTVASQFLKDGVVVYVVDAGGSEETLNVEKGGVATDLPLAVLVNGGSASASEVVAGALQDHGRGPIIGTTTFGKGAVNHFRQLEDGSAIYITSGRWYTPNRQEIEGHGITPDEIVEITAEDVQSGIDPQLQRAVEYIESQT